MLFFLQNVVGNWNSWSHICWR